MCSLSISTVVFTLSTQRSVCLFLIYTLSSFPGLFLFTASHVSTWASHLASCWRLEKVAEYLA